MTQQLQYCRFCAEQKPELHLTDLTINLEVRSNTLEKLRACNISYVDFSVKHLPETICTSCVHSCDILYEFISKIKSSQMILNDLFKIDKTEDQHCEDFNSNVDGQSNLNLFHTKDSAVKLDEISVPNTVLVKNNFVEIPASNNGITKKYSTDANISWASYPWTCAHCDLNLESMEAVTEHSRTAHGVCNGFRCCDCNKIPKTFTSFIEHVRQHRNILKQFCEHCNIKLEKGQEHQHIYEFICQYCGEEFSNGEYLSEHIEKYQKKVTKKRRNQKSDALQELPCYDVKMYDSNRSETWLDYPWICCHCITKFPDQNTLRAHVKEVHGKCFGFKCVDCAKALIDFEDFVEHVRTHRPYLMYYCQYCNMKLEDTRAAVIHISEHLTDSFLCSLCGGRFESNKELEAHTSLYDPPKLRRSSRRNRPLTKEELTCEICHKVLKSLTILRAHKKLHTDRRREYTCDRCGMMFYTKGALVVHRVIHDDPEPQTCLICKKSFLTLTRLKKHEKTHNSVKAFECLECHKTFRLKEQLKGHLITHTDLLPYQCKYCEKGFKHKNVLKVHQNQHTGARPYSCNLCLMEFANWSNCNKHMKRRHGSTLSRNVTTQRSQDEPY